ncbi:DUF2829 domain-containing protein [Klebsiella pneumoniae]|nr:DUF2829 domain-containing protein [Klebsiella pneumoniae]
MEDAKNVTFGVALEAMKLGYSFRLNSWTDPRQYLYIVKGTAPKAQLDTAIDEGSFHQVDPSLFTANSDDKNPVVRYPVLVRQTSEGAEIGWVPSPREILSNNWQVVAVPGEKAAQ